MNAVAEQVLELPRSEIIRLSAVDDIFYCRQFFPKTFRQKSPEWHRDYWWNFNATDKDFFGAEIFRGGAKTTLTRAGMSKRIAFGTSRNMLSIAISETMAAHTVRWIKRQIENQTYWATFWGLQRGSKWTDDHIIVINAIMEMEVNILAKGMTSSIRGVNLDDWRPDFITCDDISNEETVGTEDQRTKNSELFFGTIVPALAPKSEAPNRKLVLNQTGLHKDDIINKTHTDPTFYTTKYPKLVYNAETYEPESAWPERYPLEEVLQEREDYTKRNQYHIWLREFGCKIISRETAPLNPDWLRYWTSLPTNLVYFGGLDPAISKAKTAHRTAGGKVGLDPRSGDIYLISYFAQQGKNPDEMWKWCLEECWRHPFARVRKMGVETIAFQKFLAWYFKQQMQAMRSFYVIDEVQDKRSKDDRIIQAFSGIGSQGHFYVSENHTEFVRGFSDWREGVDWDLGDAVAQAITLALGLAVSSIDYDDAVEAYLEEEKQIPDIVYQGGAP